MVSSISLGSVYQSNGKNVVGGTQSQLDIESIVDSLVEVKRLPAVRLETANKAIDSKVTAYGELKTILSRLQTATDNLRNPPGVNVASKNIFEYRTASLTSSSSLPASNYLSMTVEAGAAVQSFQIDEITQLAKETKQASNSFTLADTTTASVVTASGVHTAGLFSAGSFTLRSATGGTNSTITLEDGDSLQEVVNKFNEVKSNTGIQANILKVATGSGTNTYQIVFTATKTGTTYGFDLESATAVPTDPDGVLSMLSFGTTQFAQNAQMTIDGVPIERESNSIDDLISGMTFNLLQPTPALTTLTATVRPDTDIVTNAITEFADAYNAFRLFAAEQSEIGSDGLPAETAILGTETLMRTSISQIASEVASVVGGIASGNFDRLADIGVNFSDFAGDDTNIATKNIMVIDTEKLTSALSSNYDQVRAVFEFQMTSNNSNLAIYKRTNALAVSEFTLSVDQTNGLYTASYVDGNGITQTGNFTATPIGSTGGVTLTGEEGSVFDGLQLIYASAVDATISVNISQGYGDRFYNLMDSILNDTEGTLTQELENLSETQTRNEDAITKIDEDLVTYRDKLTAQYASLESALTTANQILALLTAQQDAMAANS